MFVWGIYKLSNIKTLQMKKTIIIYFLFIFSNLLSQENLQFNIIKSELEKATNTLYVKLSIPSSDFYIEITKDSIINNPFYEPCVELKSNLTKNKKIIDILEKHDFLNEFYITVEDQLVKISNNNNSNFGNQIMNIELIFKSKSIRQPVILLIFKKDEAEKFLNKLSDLFDNNECFLKMKKEI